MSTPANVYAGNVGDVLPVAKRTDADGNYIQLVDVSAHATELTGSLGADSFVYLDVDAYNTLFLNVGNSVTIGAFDGNYELTVVDDDDEEIGNVTLFSVHTGVAALPQGQTNTDPVAWKADVSPFRRLRLATAGNSTPLNYVVRLSTDGPPQWTWPIDGNSLRTTITNDEIVAQERWESAAQTGTIADDDEFVSIIDCNEVLFQIDGTFDGTLVAEISVNGSTWVELSFELLRDCATGAAPAELVPSVYLLTFGAWIPRLRLRGTGWSSGSASVKFTAKDVTGGA